MYFFTAVRLVLSSCIQGCYGGHNYHYFTQDYSDGRGMTRDSVDAFIVSLEFCYREIVILDSLNVLSAVQRRCLEYTRDGFP